MRLDFSRKTGLALKALAELAASEQLVSRRDLAERLGTTAHFLPQVMRHLVAAKFVDSSTGPNGGYRLQTDLAEINLLEVIEMIEGPFDLGQCISTGDPCPAKESCALHIPWTRAKDAVLAELGAVTLDVVAPDSQPEG